MLTLYNKLDIHACDVTAWFSKFWRTDVSLKEFFGNALVLLPHNSDAINPPTWYLIYEVRMIFLIPLLVFICNKTSWRLAYIIICLSYIIDITFMIYVGIYIAGSLLHRYMKKYKSFRRQYSYMIFVLLILLAISFLNIRNLLNSNHIYDELFYIIQTIGALIIIYLLNTNTIIRIPKVLEFMGNISYEFYISHFVIILILAPWIEGGFILMITSLFISICVSLLMHKYMIIRL